MSHAQAYCSKSCITVNLHHETQSYVCSRILAWQISTVILSPQADYIAVPTGLDLEKCNNVV